MNKKDQIEVVNAVADKLPKTVSALDTVLSTVVGVFDLLLTPFQIAKIYKDQKLDEIKEHIKEKTEMIPQEDLKEADLTVVGPALEAMKYTIMNDDLNELFENLLVSSLDKRKNVFPGFVDIIRQINSDEAKLLKYLASSDTDSFPVITLRSETIDGKGGLDIISNFTSIGYGVCEKPELTTTYLVDLARFGLIEFVNGKYLVDDKVYEPLINHDMIKGVDKEDLHNQGLNDYKIVKGFFRITEYGKEFIGACINI